MTTTWVLPAPGNVLVLKCLNQAFYPLTTILYPSSYTLFFKFIETLNTLLHQSLPTFTEILIQLRLYDILANILNYLAPLAFHSNWLAEPQPEIKMTVGIPPTPAHTWATEHCWRKRKHTFEFIYNHYKFTAYKCTPTLSTNPSMVYLILPQSIMARCIFSIFLKYLNPSSPHYCQLIRSF